MTLWKIYFFFIAFVILFSAYYQFVTASFKILDVVNLAANLLLLLGGYSYIYKKKVFDTKTWKLVFKILVVLVVGNLLYQVWPSSYVGDFSFLNGALLTNIFAYLLSLVLFLPLYLTVHKLSLKNKK